MMRQNAQAPKGGRRKACPVFSPNNGPRFPLAGPTGKRVPLFLIIPGRAFPSVPKAESASRSESKFWDAFSAEPSIKEKDPFAEVLVNSRWRGRESRPRSARANRCGAFTPCELRWQTLSRLLSSAPSRGSIPCEGYIKEKGPLCRGPSQFKVAGKGIAPALRACEPLRRFHALRASLANAIAFTQLRALTGFDSMRGLHKRKRTPLQRS